MTIYIAQGRFTAEEAVEAFSVNSNIDSKLSQLLKRLAVDAALTK